MVEEVEVDFFEWDKESIAIWRARFEVALFECQRRLNKGAEPESYRQWQMKARALAAAMNVLNALEGK